MQTFLPYPNFAKSASVLDMRRLGKQRVETKQILTALTNPSYGWQHHPATNMWRSYELALAQYGIVICKEWRSRGYKDTLLEFFESMETEQYTALRRKQRKPREPKWLGGDEFHMSHRSNLVRKAPEHYRQFWPDVPDDLEYVWPV